MKVSFVNLVNIHLIWIWTSMDFVYLDMDVMSLNLDWTWTGPFLFGYELDTLILDLDIYPLASGLATIISHRRFHAGHRFLVLLIRFYLCMHGKKKIVVTFA